MKCQQELENICVYITSQIRRSAHDKNLHNASNTNVFIPADGVTVTITVRCKKDRDKSM